MGGMGGVPMEGVRRSARQRVSTAAGMAYQSMAGKKGGEKGGVKEEEKGIGEGGEMESPRGEEPHTVVKEIFGGILQSQVRGGEG